jgi:uncharacterized protein YjbI with pentapeptide repeats
MSSYGLDDRLREIKELREDYPVSFPIALAILIVGIMIGLGFSIVNNFGQSLYTEAISVAFTVGILNVIDQYRTKKRQSALHNILNWNLGKNPNAPITHRIFFEMIVYEALSGRVTSYFDVSDFKGEGLKIRKAFFQHCNMRSTKWNKVDFGRSRFEWVDLGKVRFTSCLMDNTRMFSSCLDEAWFRNVSAQTSRLEIQMRHARVIRVDLRNSNLSGSSFEDSIFADVNLEGVNLSNTNLRGVYFDDEVRFNASTILPDGKPYDVSKGVDQLKRFIDPRTPDFFKVELPEFSLSHVPNFNKSEGSE